ncbi:signal transduction histidine kinase/CHASE1-domain containing sensor protein [Actinoplanes lutulentus]|uniref:ATP-binding protein n=1 Tax=Actinoplanes lutulentus TaxID=1287878 RepID=UPI0018372485|nr:ATP-binding protein [Actinoplanes lutulentus]MBB2944094.1 signal transduction histidine kinase/CHASE1-domain containing sensor protein [Actinoplanes lutulentus]
MGRRIGGGLLAAGVLLTGLLVTVLVAAGLQAAQQDKAERVMDQRHAMALAAVETEIGRYRSLLEATAAGVAAQTVLTWEDFDVGTEPLDDAKLIGAAALAYVVPAADNQVAEVQRFWRGRGAEGLTLAPKGSGPEHYFPIFTRPLADGESSTGGMDLTSAPELKNALDESRRIHATAVSDTYILLRDRDNPASSQQQSFVFVAPLWSRANTPVFKGWVVLGLRGRTFLSGVLDTISQGQLFGSLEATDSDGTTVTIADWSVQGEPDLTRHSSFEVGDRSWVLTTQADSARLPGAGGHLPELVLGGGVVLTSLLAWLVWALATGRARARDQVLIATGELREAEAESRRQAGLLGAVLNSISDGVSVVDETGRVLMENPAGKRLMGIPDSNDTPGEWQQHYGVFRTDGSTPLPVEEMPLIRALHGESCDGVEIVIRNPQRPDGVLLSVDGRPLDPSAGQRGAVAVFRDITELRRYESDLQVFAGVVAHDLKAPLAIARGHAELALDDVPADSPARASLVRIVATTDRMDAMVETLLAYTTARNAPLKLRAVDLAPLVREVIEERLTHQEAAWSAGPLPLVTADPGMVRHVVDNLVGNAVKYVRPGVPPRIDVTGCLTADGWARIEVADGGIGIPDSDKPRVFESFHRTEEAAGYAGTGLGLAICRRIVERHGGEIGVADNPGGGSRFFFTLPAAPSSSPLEIAVPDTSPESPDDEAVRAALERALAERAAIMEAAHLPGLGVQPPVEEQPLRAPRQERQRQD